MKIAVFGASGRTGVSVVEQAIERGHEVVAFVRDPDRLPVADDRLHVVVGDAYAGENVAEAVAPGGEPVDAVVSVLGQGRNTPDDLVSVAGRNVLDAMAAHGVRRLVVLTGASVREEGETVTLSDRAMGGLLRLLAGDVLADADAHVADVEGRDLDWTVVRASRLVEGHPAGDYREDVDRSLVKALTVASIDRADVATFILDCTEDETYVDEMPKVGRA